MGGVDLLSWASFQPLWSSFMFLVHSARRCRFGAWAGGGEGIVGDGSRSISQDADNALQKILYIEISHDVLNLAWTLYPIRDIQVERKLHMFDRLLNSCWFPHYPYARKRIRR